MRIVIRYEDCIGKDYRDPENCAMATVLKRELNRDKLSTFYKEVYEGIWGKVIGILNPGFGARQFDMLLDKEIEEFVTEYTPI